MSPSKCYTFPNAEIKVYADRTCREFPRWCPAISVPRSRAHVASALRQLRERKRLAALAATAARNAYVRKFKRTTTAAAENVWNAAYLHALANP